MKNFPKDITELKDFVRKVFRNSEKDLLEIGDLARQNTITLSQIDDYVEDVYGQAVFNGNGSSASFQFAHGQSYVPFVIATPNSIGAKNLAYASADGTNVTLIWDTAPPAGTANVVVSYILKPSNL